MGVHSDWLSPQPSSYIFPGWFSHSFLHVFVSFWLATSLMFQGIDHPLVHHGKSSRFVPIDPRQKKNLQRNGDTSNGSPISFPLHAKWLHGPSWNRSFAEKITMSSWIKTTWYIHWTMISMGLSVIISIIWNNNLVIMVISYMSLETTIGI